MFHSWNKRRRSPNGTSDVINGCHPCRLEFRKCDNLFTSFDNRRASKMAEQKTRARETKRGGGSDAKAGDVDMEYRQHNRHKRNWMVRNVWMGSSVQQWKCETDTHSMVDMKLCYFDIRPFLNVTIYVLRIFYHRQYG